MLSTNYTLREIGVILNYFSYKSGISANTECLHVKSKSYKDIWYNFIINTKIRTIWKHEKLRHFVM